MNKLLLASIVTTSLLVGCSTVPMESKEKTDIAKQFNAPSHDKAGIYIYRKDTLVGAALKKDVWIGQDCVGETAKGVFFYKEVAGKENLDISTESEFSPNKITIKAQNGKLYFIEQYLKLGAFVGGANIELSSVETGKSEVLKLNMAKTGHCSSTLQ